MGFGMISPWERDRADSRSGDWVHIGSCHLRVSQWTVVLITRDGWNMNSVVWDHMKAFPRLLYSAVGYA